MTQNPQNLPPYRRIAEALIERIKSGELQPGDPLPSVRDIIKKEGISSATASRVPRFLRDEGWAIATPGVGTIVAAPKKLTTGADRLTLVRSGGTGLTDGEEVQFLDAERQPATQDVADALNLELGAEVARRRRKYLDDEGVAVVSATWISGALADRAPEFLAPEPLPKMTFGLIEEKTGRRVARRRDTVSISPAPADVAELLDEESGAPLLTVVNHYWDQNGEPTEYAVDYYGAGRKTSAEHDMG
ncbi:GntR family transcriptional regulator [Streptomyces yunnanensis]|uniref:Transcriptional regulator, GntR family n=1 Tax=Streptomyces yunnanensis TaxID=156453 RepID=A0A9X8QSA0_9ACTN|nr:GntR family transcriptional regulator [Streptomyces yunnanensis]SHL74466.1 transcriptional regulator, GntR family [Streptomyces yunnanensis]